MKNQILQIVKNYLNTLKLPEVINGEIVSDGIKLENNKIVPNDFVIYPSWLEKIDVTVAPGMKVRILRNLGGQSFYILDVLGGIDQ